jgi:hypothetical protein
MYKLNKKIKVIECISPDAKDKNNRHIILKGATQSQLEFLYKQKVSAVIKDGK